MDQILSARPAYLWGMENSVKLCCLAGNPLEMAWTVTSWILLAVPGLLASEQDKNGQLDNWMVDKMSPTTVLHCLVGTTF